MTAICDSVEFVCSKFTDARYQLVIFDCDGSEFVWYLTGRRGHDSTGVTDRVVNQLLTQLDGVETLEG